MTATAVQAKLPAVAYALCCSCCDGLVVGGDVSFAVAVAAVAVFAVVVTVVAVVVAVVAIVGGGGCRRRFDCVQ